MSGRSVCMVVPEGIDDPARPSGGNTYDRQVRQWLQQELPALLSAALVNADHKAPYALPETVGRFILNNYEDMPAFTDPLDGSVIATVVAMLGRLGLRLPRLADIDEHLRAEVVGRNRYSITPSNLRLALGVTSDVCLDTALGDETVYRYCLDNPAEYLAEVAERQPGALESQWIPTDPDLWHADRYREFVAARQELLVGAANAFLDELRDGRSQETPDLVALPAVVVGEADDRSNSVAAVIAELEALGFTNPERDAEVADPETGAANKELLAATSAEALAAALAALGPVAARVDELVGAGATESLESTATAVRDAVAALTA